MRLVLYASRIIIVLISFGVFLWFWDSYSIAKTKRAVESNLALQEIKQHVQNHSQCYNLIKRISTNTKDKIYIVKADSNGVLDTISHYTGLSGGFKKEFSSNSINFSNQSKVDLNMGIELLPSQNYFEDKTPVTWVDSTIMGSIVDTLNHTVIADSSSLKEFLFDAYQSKNIGIEGWRIEDHEGNLVFSSPKHLIQYSTLDTVSLFTNLAFKPSDNYLLRVEINKNELLWNWLTKWELLLALGFTALSALLLFSVERNLRSEKRLNESQQAMLNNVSHEINTQVSKILLSVERIKDSEEDQHPYFGIIEKASRGLSQGLNSFLVSGGIDSKSYTAGKTEINLKVLIEDTIENLKPKATTFNKEMETKYGELLQIRFNPTHLTQVLSNIIDNAFKYGGNQIKIAAQTKGNLAFIDITDNGPGMAPKYLQKIFDPYFRIDVPSVNGFGIGLSYCKAVIKANSGKIYAENLPNGKGFMIRLEIKS